MENDKLLDLCRAAKECFLSKDHYAWVYRGDETHHSPIDQTSRALNALAAHRERPCPQKSPAPLQSV
jgi:hypothetical protein